MDIEKTEHFRRERLKTAIIVFLIIIGVIFIAGCTNNGNNGAPASTLAEEVKGGVEENSASIDERGSNCRSLREFSKSQLHSFKTRGKTTQSYNLIQADNENSAENVSLSQISLTS